MVRKLVWWTVCIASAILSIFFLVFGINLCLASYNLDHPHQFILTFFSSNLIILISVVVLIGVVMRIIARLRHGNPPAAVGKTQLDPDSSQFPDQRDL